MRSDFTAGSEAEKNRTGRHKNIPVFIPHLGCPNNCVFCNQRVISGRQFFDENDVEKQIRTACSTLNPEDCAEIAFFGGSFTGIDRGLMVRLLETAHAFLADPRCPVKSVRCSTRPDYIDGEILSVLKKYGVETVELGIQSISDGVLAASRRGHTAEMTVKACRAVRAAGFRLIGQMMVGLPGSTPESERATAEFICGEGADGARIYPTVVFTRTELCDMAKAGAYVPLTDAEAVERTADLLEIFDAAGVPVIRTGLCSGESLSSPEEVYGGASHPAIGEMAMSEVFRRRLDRALKEISVKTAGDAPEGDENVPATVGDTAGSPGVGRTEKRLPELVIYVPQGCQSKVCGQHKSNMSFIREKYRIGKIKILEKNDIIGYNILLNIKY
ncbi:MAG: radical SAM protein [Clostridia bacterium]|nr:radical SAM protein [Clostridia bacterium]